MRGDSCFLGLRRVEGEAIRRRSHQLRLRIVSLGPGLGFHKAGAHIYPCRATQDSNANSVEPWESYPAAEIFDAAQLAVIWDILAKRKPHWG